MITIRPGKMEKFVSHLVEDQIIIKTTKQNDVVVDQNNDTAPQDLDPIDGKEDLIDDIDIQIDPNMNNYANTI